MVLGVPIFKHFRVINDDPVFLPVRQTLFYFSSAGKFCLAYGLRQLMRNFVTSVVYKDVP